MWIAERDRPRMPKRDYGLTGHERGLGGRDRARLGGVVPFRGAAEGHEGADARRGGPAIRDTALWLGLQVLTAAGGIAFWGAWWCVLFFAPTASLRLGVGLPLARVRAWHRVQDALDDVAVYHIACFMQVRNPVNWRWSHARHHTDTIIVGRDAEIAGMRPPARLKAALPFTGLMEFRDG